MGIVFGITGSKEPPFTSIPCPVNPSLFDQSHYEIRYYNPYLIAEVLSAEKESDKSFGILAKYIGVFGKPANENDEAMSMTAPVIMEPKRELPIDLSTVPFQTNSMQFVLPFEYTSLSQAPKPTDPRVTIKEIPSKLVAVRKFSGWYNSIVGLEQFQKLHDDLIRDKLLPPESKPVWSVAQYHPPFTLPFLRRNEIWIELDKMKEEVAALLPDNIRS